MTTHPRAAGLYAARAATAAHLSATVSTLAARGVPASAVTWASFAAAAAAAAAVVAGAVWAPAWWLLVGPAVAVRLLAAVADGELARRTGTCTPAGAALGELLDRAGDVLMLGALVPVQPVAAAVAVVGALAADSVAAVAWAVMGRRSFPGVGGKPDRGAALAFGLAVAVAWPPGATTTAIALAAVTWTCTVQRADALRREAVAA